MSIYNRLNLIALFIFDLTRRMFKINSYEFFMKAKNRSGEDVKFKIFIYFFSRAENEVIEKFKVYQRY